MFSKVAGGLTMILAGKMDHGHNYFNLYVSRWELKVQTENSTLTFPTTSNYDGLQIIKWLSCTRWNVRLFYIFWQGLVRMELSWKGFANLKI
ncbi:hypothetical protein GUJ93_ZPchr0007g3438 [Zizania palustris]|uniref:Uncharacterized protein n=2 Tax=Zizania palustris TaxID=103762 RepID=A0A8J5VNV6_ZIZPA|nr:hypothetical protein GUJ93_ZPchr0006g41723 [Zizania palustris]KAG8079232.1 hypothetical protein GUJ93_ZPchr0007g3438 [Zizania palustris]